MHLDDMTRQGHTGSVRDLQFDASKIISSGADSLVLIHDYATGQQLQILRGHVDAVLALQFDLRRMVTVSADHTLRHWHFQRPKKSELVLRKFHSLDEGETLTQVARRYNISLHKLCVDNGIDEDSADADEVFPGKQLLVRTMENDYREPNIVTKATGDFNKGLVRRIRVEVQKATDDAARDASVVAVGADTAADKSIAELRRERVKLQLMDREAQRDILRQERDHRRQIELTGPTYEDTSDEDEEGFTGEV